MADRGERVADTRRESPVEIESAALKREQGAQRDYDSILKALKQEWEDKNRPGLDKVLNPGTLLDTTRPLLMKLLGGDKYSRALGESALLQVLQQSFDPETLATRTKRLLQVDLSAPRPENPEIAITILGSSLLASINGPRPESALRLLHENPQVKELLRQDRVLERLFAAFQSLAKDLGSGQALAQFNRSFALLGLSPERKEFYTKLATLGGVTAVLGSGMSPEDKENSMISLISRISPEVEGLAAKAIAYRSLLTFRAQLGEASVIGAMVEDAAIGVGLSTRQVRALEKDPFYLQTRRSVENYLLSQGYSEAESRIQAVATLREDQQGYENRRSLERVASSQNVIRLLEMASMVKQGGLARTPSAAPENFSRGVSPGRLATQRGSLPIGERTTRTEKNTAANIDDVITATEKRNLLDRIVEAQTESPLLDSIVNQQAAGVIKPLGRVHTALKNPTARYQLNLPPPISIQTHFDGRFGLRQPLQFPDEVRNPSKPELLPRLASTTTDLAQTIANAVQRSRAQGENIESIKAYVNSALLMCFPTVRGGEEVLRITPGKKDQSPTISYDIGRLRTFASHGDTSAKQKLKQALSPEFRSALETKFGTLFQNIYKGSLENFLSSVSRDELLSPVSLRPGEMHNTISFKDYGISSVAELTQATRMYLYSIGRIDEAHKLRQYHFKSKSIRAGYLESETHRMELICKKLDRLLAEEYNGNLKQMLASITSDKMYSPFYEDFSDARIQVSMGGLKQLYKGSPLPMLKNWLQFRGRVKLADGIQKYHLGKAAEITDETRAELVNKKCSRLLEDKFGGDLNRMIAEVTKADLRENFTETVDGINFEISMSAVLEAYNSSPYKFVTAWIKARGDAQLAAALRPYHFSRAGIYSDEVRMEVLDKKFQKLLRFYGGDIAAMISETPKNAFESSFVEEVAGRSFEVSVLGLNLFQEKPLFEILKTWLEYAGYGELARELRPYHLHRVGKYHESLRSEVLKKKCDSLLSEKYGGDLARMISEVTGEEIASPLIESVAGYKFEVSLYSATTYYEYSPFRIMKAWLEESGRKTLADALRPYHLNKVLEYTPEHQAELLKRMCEELLRLRFNGDKKRMLEEFRIRNFPTEFTDKIGDIELRVTTPIVRHYNNSPYEMLKQWFEIEKWAFPYTREIFMGSAEVRRRRMSGDLKTRDLLRFRREDGSFDSAALGFRQFSGPDKNAVREIIVETVEELFGDRDVRYLGLETERLESLRILGERVNVSNSTIVERDPRVIAAIRAQKPAIEKFGGVVDVVEGEIGKAPLPAGASFNVLNLDFVGHLSKGKELTLKRLFEQNNIATDALIFLTLGDEPIDHNRSARDGYTGDAVKGLQALLTRVVPPHLQANIEYSVPYIGGTNQNTRKMLTICIQVSLATAQATERVMSSPGAVSP